MIRHKELSPVDLTEASLRRIEEIDGRINSFITVTGGSSSGSGAALAAGLCFGTLGSDTGGSIRNPASQCGTAGLKPTYGRISRTGVIPLSWSLDHAGPMARSVEDIAHLLQALAG